MLIFTGLRFPAASATERHRAPIPLPDGTLIAERDYVIVTTAGRGRLWVPEPGDATWRSLAEMDLADPADCQQFVRRRGDPADRDYRNIFNPDLSVIPPEEYVRRRGDIELAKDRQVNTIRWWHLAAALRFAAENWLEPNEDGVSHPRVRKSSRHVDRRFLNHQATRQGLFETRLIAAHKGNQLLAFQATTLAAFLTLRAAQALKERRPMQRCAQCGFWFEIRRKQPGPRFCSNSCRAQHHQRPETPHGLDT